PRKRAILEFVTAVTDPQSESFVPPEQRIAVFDNDGTLWTEHPLYTQLQFVIDRVRSQAAAHPEWKDKEPFRAVLTRDRRAMAQFPEQDVAALVAATHSGMTAEEFERVARRWLDTAEHPRFKRLYKQCVYQPMLELLAHLRTNGFRIHIVTGGG